MCSGKEETLDGLCQKCSVGIIARNRWYDANIPIEFWSIEMKDFVGPEPLKKAYEHITSNIEKFYSDGVSICFCGTHGIGKSTVSCNILKFACLKNYSAYYTTLSEIVSALVSAPFDEQYAARKILTMVDMLVVDEFDGRHFGKGLSEDLYGRTLDGIFRIRSQNKLNTVFITNSPNPIEAFSGQVKESIDSLLSKTKIISVRGEDQRKKENK